MLGNISYSIFIYIDKHIEEGENGDQTYLQFGFGVRKGSKFSSSTIISNMYLSILSTIRNWWVIK